MRYFPGTIIRRIILIMTLISVSRYYSGIRSILESTSRDPINVPERGH